MPTEPNEASDEDMEMLAYREERHKQRMDVLATLEKRIGIPVGFFWSIRSEQDDWAYIVKLAVICEAAVTHALVMATKSDQLLDHFSDLTQARRLELAKQLGVISDEDRLALGAIASVRNQFAHRVDNLGGSLRTFYFHRTQEQKIDLISKLAQLETKPKKDANMEGHQVFFKLMLFAAAMKPLQTIANFGVDVDKKTEEEKLKSIRTLSDLLKGSNPDEWWQAGSSPVSMDSLLVGKEAPKAAQKK